MASTFSGSTRAAAKSDRRLVLYVTGAIVVLVVLFCLFGPAPAGDDQKPTSFNNETPGIRASYLLLSELGYNAQRWQQPVTELKNVDPQTTTLLLIEPTLPLRDRKVLQDAVADFLSRGGYVLATGATGATLLPGGDTAEPTRDEDAPDAPALSRNAPASAREMLHVCMTRPEGPGALAQAGPVQMEDDRRWSATGPQFRVAQRCGPDSVVVGYRYGAGQAVWWASDLPLTNGGLSGSPQDHGGNPQQTATLRLLLASVGAAAAGTAGAGGTVPRTVLFDEFLHEWHESILPDSRPLPWWPILWQLLTVALLLLLSLGRRGGPVRLPVSLPRTSPVEFAYSMGHLYQRAGATSAAVDAAHGRLLSVLEERCGLTKEVLRGGPRVIADTLAGRFGGDYSALETHLEQARAQQGQPLGAKAALKLVQALEVDRRALAAQIQLQPRGAAMRHST